MREHKLAARGQHGCSAASPTAEGCERLLPDMRHNVVASGKIMLLPTSSRADT